MAILRFVHPCSRAARAAGKLDTSKKAVIVSGPQVNLHQKVSNIFLCCDYCAFDQIWGYAYNNKHSSAHYSFVPIAPRKLFMLNTFIAHTLRSAVYAVVFCTFSFLGGMNMMDDVPLLDPFEPSRTVVIDALQTSPLPLFIVSFDNDSTLPMRVEGRQVTPDKPLRGRVVTAAVSFRVMIGSTNHRVTFIHPQWIPDHCHAFVFATDLVGRSRQWQVRYHNEDPYPDFRLSATSKAAPESQ